MIGVFHLTRLHIGRMIASRGIALSGALIVLAVSAGPLFDVRPSRCIAYAIFALFAVAAAAVQSSADRASGFTEGVRTTPVSDFAVSVSRLAVVPVAIVLQVLVMEIASRVVAVIA